MRALPCLTLLLFACGGLPTRPVAITTVHDAFHERETVRELQLLLERHDLERWTWTRSVQIDEDAIPHSHPVLTLHARHLGDEEMLLATYLHEQLHWAVNTVPVQRDAAIASLRALYPNIPTGHPEGAGDEESGWLHLLVCSLERYALAEVVGEDRADAIIARMGHYTWIYARTLADPRVAELSADVRAVLWRP